MIIVTTPSTIKDVSQVYALISYLIHQEYT